MNNEMLITEPQYYKGNSVGFIFFHGFTAGPYEGRELAELLHRELGFTVSLPLLPGHGTHPSALKDVTWLDWYFFVRDQYIELKKHCKRVIVCGQSMGGTLALHLASHHEVDGVISLAGAVFLKDWRLHLLPLARMLFTYHYKSKGPDICDTRLKENIPAYSKYPVRAVDQLLSLLEHARLDLAEIYAPALLMHSRKDRTVHFDNLHYIYDHIASPYKEKVILNESYHVLSLDVEKEEVFRHILLFSEKFISQDKLS